MRLSILESNTKSKPYIIWMVGTSFVLLQFFLQLSSGVVINKIMLDMQLSALMTGILSSSFYIIYTCLQIPVGILCDRNNPRVLLATSALILCLGCVLFAESLTFTGLLCGRTLIGCGSAFAFVGLTHLLRQYYPAQKFAVMIGITETFSFIVTVLGIIGIGEVIQIYGWRYFIQSASLVSAIIAGLCWRYIPDESNKLKSNSNENNQFLLVLSNKLLWINGLFIGLTFAVVTVFGALWAVPFLKVKLHCGLREASLINALFFLGTGFSCPLFGILSHKVKKRKPLIIYSCIITALLLFIALYLPTQNAWIMGVLLALIGLSCGAYILAYPISNELAPANGLSTSTGLTNTLALITTPLLQPLVGLLLEISSHGQNYTIKDYQFALLILPISFIVSCVLVWFLPEKPPSN